MKKVTERNQSLPSTEAIIPSVTRDKCFKLSYLKLFVGFLLAVKIKSKLLPEVYKVLQNLFFSYLSTSFVD